MARRPTETTSDQQPSPQRAALRAFRRDRLAYTTWSDRAATLDELFAQIGEIDSASECAELYDFVFDLCADHIGYAFGPAERKQFTAMVAALERLGRRWLEARDARSSLKAIRALERKLVKASRDD